MITSILFTGGARSGKSRLAKEWAEQHAQPRVYIATADPEAADAEMSQRIKRHRDDRGPGWESTIVEPNDITASILEAARGGARTVLVDCITLWLTNLGFSHSWNEAPINEAIDRLASVVAKPPCDLVLVTNEVGSGIVPQNAIGRRFRDLQGFANQRLAKAAKQVALVSCGLPLWLKVAQQPQALVANA
jgi:adenosylcobinamide kinase/adenosylcobinamide-phosphate guanylyltransferase